MCEGTPESRLLRKTTTRQPYHPAPRQPGSHIILRRDNPFAQLVVPDHKELDRGTLRAIIREAHLTVDQFNDLL